MFRKKHTSGKSIMTGKGVVVGSKDSQREIKTRGVFDMHDCFFKIKIFKIIF